MSASRPKFRILLVDDSSVVRRVLSDLISGDPQLEVAGTAPEGRTALKRISELRPDLVVMDVEMPVMDGLTAVAAISRTDRHLPIIMFSTLTHRGATATLAALTLGAAAYVPKARTSLALAASMAERRDARLAKSHALCL